MIGDLRAEQESGKNRVATILCCSGAEVARLPS